MKFIDKDNHKLASSIAKEALDTLSSLLGCSSYTCIFAGDGDKENHRAIGIVMDDSTPLEHNINDLGNALSALLDEQQPGGFRLTIENLHTGQSVVVDPPGDDDRVKRVTTLELH